MPYKTAELRFYGDLVDFLDGGGPLVERTFDVAPSVKDTIEACGVPHPEVDLILVDGVSVGWDDPVRDGSRIAVYPRFHTFDVAGISAVHVEQPEPRFLLDVHLGTLTRYLRLLGFNSVALEDPSDEELAATSARTTRALLSRDLGLLKRSVVRHGYFLRSRDPVMQAVEVVRHFDLADRIAPFTRCMACNGEIGEVEADEARRHVPDGVARNHETFRRCSECERLYWEGTHFDRLEELVTSIRALAAGR